MPPSTPNNNGTNTSNANLYSLLLISGILIALFPGLFHALWTLPFSLLYTFSSRTTSSSRAVTTATTDTSCCCTVTTTPTTNTQPAQDQHQHQRSTMSWSQKQFTLPPRSRGSYLVTDHVVSSLPELKSYKVGILHLFVQHTSCALSLNENWDEDVRADMSDALDRIAPESGKKGEELYRHSAEGPDDMPAHIKSALVGASVTIPIKDGKLVGSPSSFSRLGRMQRVVDANS